MGISSQLATSLAALALLVAATSQAADQVRSARQACQILKRSAVTYRLSTRDLASRYYCDYYDPAFWTKEFIVLGLRYHDRPEEKVGSNLIGWFGIRRSDGALFEWNLEGFPELLREPSTW
jgi:hypothetical protein